MPNDGWRDADYVEGVPGPYKYAKAASGKGNVDPETLGGSRQSIKAIVNHNAVTVADARAELARVYQAFDQYDGRGGSDDRLTPSERVLLRRRVVVLLARIRGKDMRYRVAGARRGWLGKAEQERVTMRRAVQDMIDSLGM